MVKIVFVHGTGVREPQFGLSLASIKTKADKFLRGHSVHPCYWGGDHGALLKDGRSIPLYDTTRALEADPATALRTQWSMLYDEPTLELTLLALQKPDDAQLPPGNSALSQFKQALRDLEQQETASSPTTGVKSLVPAAMSAIVNWPDLDQAATAGIALAPLPPAKTGNVRKLVARAIAAEWIRHCFAAGLPIPTGAQRDDVVDRLEAKLLGGEAVQTKGLSSTMLQIVKWPLKKMAEAAVVNPALRLGAWASRNYRHSLADAVTPAVGDTVKYQARGQGMRDFIRETVEDVAVGSDEGVVLLAHSLGGIACVDLLVQEPLPQVKGLITVGSQAPYLYEIGALFSLAAPSQLPEHMPPWLNVYDCEDLLSFKAMNVFSSAAGVEDFEVKSDQPFPASHGAYWSDDTFWEKADAFLKTFSREAR